MMETDVRSILGRGMVSRRLILQGAACCVMSGAAQAASPRLTFAELYDVSEGKGLKFSSKLQQLDGQGVVMNGFMAAPLKPESDFFVLTRFPMSVCPFCAAEADWPSDIVVVYLAAAAQTLAPSQLIHVSGRLEIGMKMDQATAFVSMIRLVEAKWEVA